MVVDASEYAVERRRLKFTQKYGDLEHFLKSDDAPVEFPPSIKGLYRSDSITRTSADDTPCDVAFSCAPADRKYVTFVSRVLQQVSPGLVIRETADTENERLALMESARKVVVFLSANYLESLEQIEEFHTILLRQRYRSDLPVLFPIMIHNLPQLPTYFHLIHCDFHLFDPLWMELYAKYRVSLPWDLEYLRRISKKSTESNVERYSSFGVVAAIHSLLVQLKTER